MKRPIITITVLLQNHFFKPDKIKNKGLEVTKKDVNKAPGAHQKVCH